MSLSERIFWRNNNCSERSQPVFACDSSRRQWEHANPRTHRLGNHGCQSDRSLEHFEAAAFIQFVISTSSEMIRSCASRFLLTMCLSVLRRGQTPRSMKSLSSSCLYFMVSLACFVVNSLYASGGILDVLP